MFAQRLPRILMSLILPFFFSFLIFTLLCWTNIHKNHLWTETLVLIIAISGRSDIALLQTLRQCSRRGTTWINWVHRLNLVSYWPQGKKETVWSKNFKAKSWEETSGHCQLVSRPLPFYHLHISRFRLCTYLVRKRVGRDVLASDGALPSSLVALETVLGETEFYA